LAKKNEPSLVNEVQEVDIGRLKQRLDMLDQRLDNIDSVVTAVVERVMKQPITFNVTCSKCGQNIEIALIGTEKPSK
jgi:tRNA(Ser,Leu) C12 N-acetylase TAN1